MKFNITNKSVLEITYKSKNENIVNDLFTHEDEVTENAKLSIETNFGSLTLPSKEKDSYAIILTLKINSESKLIELIMGFGYESDINIYEDEVPDEFVDLAVKKCYPELKKKCDEFFKVIGLKSMLPNMDEIE